MTDQHVEPAQWVAHHGALRDQGDAVLETLTAIDRGDALEVVSVVRRGRGTLVSRTSIPGASASLASLTSCFPSAAWLERETAEMFGVAFTEHPDPRPLLLRSDPRTPPLRRSVPLPERLAIAWPGAREVNEGRRARRTALPPGVRPEWLAESGGPA